METHGEESFHCIERIAKLAIRAIEQQEEYSGNNYEFYICFTYLFLAIFVHV